MKWSVGTTFLFIALFAFGGCKIVNVVDPSQNPQGPNSISIEVNKGNSIQGNDTLYVEPGVSITFRAKSNGSVNIVTYNWIFNDDSSHSSGEIATHTYLGITPFVTSIKLVGIDSNNNSFEIVKVIKVIASLDGLPSIQWISSVPQTGGAFIVTMAFHKAYMKFAGSNYFYIGDMTNWSAVNIDPADTNYIITDNHVFIPVGEIGKYVVARMLLKPGEYKMGLGKLVGSNQIWGTFWGPYSDSSNSTMIRFTVDNNGKVSATGKLLPTYPGFMGDDYVRFSFEDTKILIYTRHTAPFSSLTPFCRFPDNNSNGALIVKESAVDKYADWGVFPLEYTVIPSNGLITMHYGPYYETPEVYSANESKSSYYDPYFKILKMIFHQIPVKNITGKEKKLIVSTAVS